MAYSLTQHLQQPALNEAPSIRHFPKERDGQSSCSRASCHQEEALTPFSPAPRNRALLPRGVPRGSGLLVFFWPVPVNPISSSQQNPSPGFARWSSLLLSQGREENGAAASTVRSPLFVHPGPHAASSRARPSWRSQTPCRCPGQPSGTAATLLPALCPRPGIACGAQPELLGTWGQLCHPRGGKLRLGCPERGARPPSHPPSCLVPSQSTGPTPHAAG